MTGAVIGEMSITLDSAQERLAGEVFVVRLRGLNQQLPGVVRGFEDPHGVPPSDLQVRAVRETGPESLGQRLRLLSPTEDSRIVASELNYVGVLFFNRFLIKIYSLNDKIEPKVNNLL